MHRGFKPPTPPTTCWIQTPSPSIALLGWEPKTLAIWSKGREGAVVRTRCKFLEGGSVRVDNGHLRAALHPIAGFEKLGMEASEKRRKLADGENDPVAGGQPSAWKYVPVLVPIDHAPLSGLHVRHVETGAARIGGC